MTETRAISEIAADIEKYWPNIAIEARPYMEAMKHLKRLEDRYEADDGRYIIVRFLSNASKWRGSDARWIKNEIRMLINEANVINRVELQLAGRLPVKGPSFHPRRRRRSHG